MGPILTQHGHPSFNQVFFGGMREDFEHYPYGVPLFARLHAPRSEVRWSCQELLGGTFGDFRIIGSCFDEIKGMGLLSNCFWPTRFSHSGLSHLGWGVSRIWNHVDLFKGNTIWTCTYLRLYYIYI